MNDTVAELTLYFSPGACSRVSLVALEECGLDYASQTLALQAGQQKQPAYLALNPKGKVPLLVTPQGTLSENVAILGWLDAMQPQAGLLPGHTQAWARAQAMSWLAWSASTLHPLVYRARMMPRIHPDVDTHAAIRDAALAEMGAQLGVAEQALADGRPWLMGGTWCIADTHVCWAYGRGVIAGLDGAAFPGLAALVERQAGRPAFQRALAREEGR